MPIPKVICCVCGQEVNKAQTLHIGGGKRACKNHEGTLESSKLELAKIAQQKKDEIESAAKAKEAKRQEKERQSITVEPHCLICGKKGLRQEEWYTRYMIEMKKYEITHGKLFNPFTEASQFDALKGTACLFYVLWHGENTKIKVPFDVYQFTQFQKSMGIEEPLLLVCQDCVVVKRFISLSQERIDRLIDDDNFFRLIGIAHAAIEPEIMQAAMKEIIESN
jgi:hypothetical protein